MAMPQLVNATTQDLKGGEFDAVLFIAPNLDVEGYDNLCTIAKGAAEVDARVGKSAVLIHSSEVAGGRLIYSPTGPLNRDYDDVRSFYDAGTKAMETAIAAGAKKPLIAIAGVPQESTYTHAIELTLLGSLAGLYQPLEAREDLGEDVEGIEKLGSIEAKDLNLINALEEGRRLSRDLTVGNAERLAPVPFAQLVKESLAGLPVEVSIQNKIPTLDAEYPLMMSVARASLPVARHRPCVVRLHYRGSGPIKETLLFAGKGVTYDTGGADIKYGGHMAGMSRDKGGAASVAGFLKTVAMLKPENLEIIAELGMVRNSVGAEGFVSDDIIKSHAGVRVRIGNTDAEGRLVMGDLLSHLREDALKATNPHLFSVATLTGHAVIAMGNYTAVLDNGPAHANGTAASLCESGDAWGDPCEHSRLRREDYKFVAARTKSDDVLSCNNAPSSGTPRGHQFPMAFLAISSGLDKHGKDSDQPLPYTHIDIAGSSVEGPDHQHDRPSGSPVLALAGRYLLG